MEGTGTLSVLNVGAGDLKFTFARGDAAEVDRARRVVLDMLRRGYVLFVETPDGGLRKVHGFDPETDSYILKDVPGDQALGIGDDPGPAPGGDTDDPVPAPKRRGRPPKERVPMKDAKATALAPTAGG